MPVPQKGKITDGWGLVLAGGESLLRLFPVGHLFLYFLAALTLGGVGKTWTMKQRQTQWCHRKGNDLVGKMGLSMVSAGSVARALLGLAGARSGAPAADMGQLRLLCSSFPAQKGLRLEAGCDPCVA